MGGFLGILYRVLPFLYLVLLELGAADIGLLDEEHDISIIGLLDDALEAIRSDDGANTCKGSKSFRGDDTISDLQIWELDDAVTLLALEVEVKLALGHRRDVGEYEVDCGIATIGVMDDAVVAVDLFPLEGRSCPPFFATLVAKDGNDGQGCVLGEPLSWEGEMHRYGYRYLR